MNCRLCLIKCEDFVSIFGDNDNENFLKLIFKHLYLKIQPDDLYSTNLCQNCAKNLQDFHNFFECIQKCQSSLQILKEGSVFDKSKTCRLCMKECEDAVSIITGKSENSCLQWIEKYLFIKIKPDDVHSTGICQKCNTKLQDFHNFFKCAQDCQFNLKNMEIAENKTTQQSLNVKKETAQEFLENGDHEWCKVANETVALEQVDRNQSMDKSFLDVSIKTEFLSATDESDCCENDEFPEDSETTSELSTKFTFPEDEAIICGNCCIEFESNEMLDNHFKETECKSFQEIKPNACYDMKSRTCAVCSKVYDTIAKMKFHMLVKHDKKNENIANRTCSICSKVSTTVYSLKQHMRIVHNTRQETVEHRTCRLCSKEFATIRNMKNHMRFQHDKKNEDIANRTCSICSTVLSTVYGMKQHMYLQHHTKQDGAESHKCRVCSKIFDTIGRMKNHMLVKHNKKNEDIANRTCSICSTVSSSVYALKRHMRNLHITKQETVERRTCRMCSKVFDTIKKMRVHIYIEHNKKNEGIANRTCSLCSAVLSTVFALKVHMSNLHNTKQETVERRTCLMCSEVFDSIKRMRNHMYRKHNKKNEDIANRTCSICSAVSSTIYGLNRHMRVRHNTKGKAAERHTCSLCSKVFDQIIQLDSHMSKEHKNSEQAIMKPRKQNNEAIENANDLLEMNCEMRRTPETKWSADLQVKEEEPLEINDFLED